MLVHPEIHWNTGNAGRTCLAVGATLHLIEPLGFSLREREVKRRRVPVLLCLLILLSGFGTWNFLRITRPPVLPAVQAEQAARAQLFLIASSLDRYREERGRLPVSLAQAGLDATGVEYRLEGGRYRLVARTGPMRITLREGDDKTPFAAALGIGGDS